MLSVAEAEILITEYRAKALAEARHDMEVFIDDAIRLGASKGNLKNIRPTMTSLWEKHPDLAKEIFQAYRNKGWEIIVSSENDPVFHKKDPK